ncbi:uncharacterized protein LOC113272480 [Papaver somniferum]|uniref:uncharacterized protein LOC113272480 n=1 Tax=Papaver somniferum TaxID=3469 RepID=UPI000E6F9302|nr:uncharacterized protein LOC113272480 [Papaver somniferum]
MNSIIQKIISPQQCAFIKGGNIHEQVLLAYEMVNEMNIKRRGGNVGLKLDISQAYDTLSWNFLTSTMKKYGFSDKFCHWIHVLLQTTKISIILNGGPIGYFGVGRGVIQGDPLSRIIYILAADTQDGKIQPMVIRRGIYPSHIFFADDIFIFCNGCKTTLLHLKNLLLEYQNASCQVVSADKSKCFVDGTTPTRQNQIVELMNMRLSSFPDKYLGVILVQGKFKAEHLWAFLDMLQRRLASWIGLCLISKKEWVLQDFENNSRWIVGKGDNISVWKDPWILESSILSHFPTTDNIQQHINMKVSELIQNNTWVIPEEILTFINIDDLPPLSLKEDKLIWIGNQNGEFTVSCAVNAVRTKQPKMKWKVKTVRAIECFFYLPEDGITLLCCDGASRGNPCYSGYGFIARDSSGNFLTAESGGLGITTNFVAEILGTISALEWALIHLKDKLIINSDSTAAINAFMKNNLPLFVLSRWQIICNKVKSIHFNHVYREINFSANFFSKKGVYLDKGKSVKFATRPPNMLKMEFPGTPYYIFA